MSAQELYVVQDARGFVWCGPGFPWSSHFATGRHSTLAEAAALVADEEARHSAAGLRVLSVTSLEHFSALRRRRNERHETEVAELEAELAGMRATMTQARRDHAELDAELFLAHKAAIDARDALAALATAFAEEAGKRDALVASARAVDAGFRKVDPESLFAGLDLLQLRAALEVYA